MKQYMKCAGEICCDTVNATRVVKEKCTTLFCHWLVAGQLAAD